MLSKKQKIISVGALACLVLLAAVLNHSLARNGKKPQAQQVNATVTQVAVTPDKVTPEQLEFVSSYKTQRVQTRQEETAYLETILNDEKTDATTRKAAQEQLMVMVGNAQKELAIEALLEAKGFNQIAVAIHNDTINVIVGTEQLNDDQVAQILEIATREGKVEATNVKVIPAASKNS